MVEIEIGGSRKERGYDAMMGKRKFASLRGVSLGLIECRLRCE